MAELEKKVDVLERKVDRLAELLEKTLAKFEAQLSPEMEARLHLASQEYTEQLNKINSLEVPEGVRFRSLTYARSVYERKVFDLGAEYARQRT